MVDQGVDVQFVFVSPFQGFGVSPLSLQGLTLLPVLCQAFSLLLRVFCVQEVLCQLESK